MLLSESAGVKFKACPGKPHPIWRGPPGIAIPVTGPSKTPPPQITLTRERGGQEGPPGETLSVPVPELTQAPSLLRSGGLRTGGGVRG